MIPDEIRQPEDLAYPVELEELMQALEPNGQQQFLAELLQALRKSQDSNNLAPVQRVIDAWYRTMLFVAHMGPDREVILQHAAVAATSEKPMTATQVTEYIRA